MKESCNTPLQTSCKEQLSPAASGSLAPTVLASPCPSSNREETNRTDRHDKDTSSVTTSLHRQWKHWTHALQSWLVRQVVALAVWAARHPYTTIVSISLLSVGMITLGLLTNFQVNVRTEIIFAPFNNVHLQHEQWIKEASGFVDDVRTLTLVVHAHGDNVLYKDDARHVFDALNVVRETEGYDAFCQLGSHVDQHDQKTCNVYSVTRYWDHNETWFDESMQTDEDLMEMVRQNEFPEGTPVDPSVLFGSYEVATATNSDPDGGTYITYIPAYFTLVMLPNVDGAEELEQKLLHNLGDLARQWHDDTQQHLQLEYMAARSMGDEFQRAIAKDMPLLPFVGVIMAIFTCVVFYNRSPVRSQCGLGLGSVLTIGFAIMTGFGLMFTMGIYFTSMTQLLPFVIVGVGLDDTFIITVAYGRLGHVLDPVERIRLTMEEVGPSILVTTVSTVFAFALGLISSIPAIFWLCLYAFVTIFIDFIYQVSFFVALIVLDDRRMKAGQWDIVHTALCFCPGFGNVKVDDETSITTNTPDDSENREELQLEAPLSHQFTATEALPMEGGTNQDRDVAQQIVHFLDDVERVMRASTAQTPQLKEGQRALHEECQIHQPQSERHEGQPNQRESTSDDLQVGDTDTIDVESLTDESLPLDFHTCPADGALFLGSFDSASTIQHSNIYNHSNTHQMRQVGLQHKLCKAEPQRRLVERFMSWYASKLLSKTGKILVLISFALGHAACIYGTTQLSQQMKLEDLFPSDSYATSMLRTVDTYSQRTASVGVYFRDCDQSDPQVQQQMLNYIDSLVSLPQFEERPPFCWVRDFQKLLTMDEYGDALADMTFQQQMKFALSIPALKEVYGNTILFDEDGNITASRCWIPAGFDLDSAKDQMKYLRDEQALTASQPINKETNDWSFFTFADVYYVWEIYGATVNELISTTVSGVAAVAFVTFLFIPHWSAVVFILPLFSICYIDLLGSLYFAGLHINVVSYVCLVISVGLLVDFLVHILLKYHETRSTHRSRKARVKETLETMGASILLGGLSTFLGITPLAFSTSSLFRTVFTCWMSMIILGVTHGLMLLPVLLSMFGPNATLHEGKNQNITAQQSRDKAFPEKVCLKRFRSSSTASTVSSKIVTDEASTRDDIVSYDDGAQDISTTDEDDRDGPFPDSCSEYSCESVHV